MSKKLFSVEEGSTFMHNGRRMKKTGPKGTGKCVDIDTDEVFDLATMLLVALVIFGDDGVEEVEDDGEAVNEVEVSAPVEPVVEEPKSFFADSSVNDNSTYDSGSSSSCDSGGDSGGGDCGGCD